MSAEQQLLVVLQPISCDWDSSAPSRGACGSLRTCQALIAATAAGAVSLCCGAEAMSGCCRLTVGGTEAVADASTAAAVGGALRASCIAAIGALVCQALSAAVCWRFARS